MPEEVGRVDDEQRGERDERGVSEHVRARPAPPRRAPQQREENRHQDDRDAGQEGGLRSAGELDAGGLEFVAGKQAQTGQRARLPGRRRDPTQSPAVDGGQSHGGQGHAQKIEEQGRNIAQ